ncbi:MAG: hypothetical protein EON54_01765 [Alcaligenaceae bacterium]|nr:MAG: hypothetical protein EON54_01765 [Alcaligenaceae bacterium]
MRLHGKRLAPVRRMQLGGAGFIMPLPERPIMQFFQLETAEMLAQLHAEAAKRQSYHQRLMDRMVITVADSRAALARAEAADERAKLALCLKKVDSVLAPSKLVRSLNNDGRRNA